MCKDMNSRGLRGDDCMSFLSVPDVVGDCLRLTALMHRRRTQRPQSAAPTAIFKVSTRWHAERCDDVETHKIHGQVHHLNHTASRSDSNWSWILVTQQQW